MVGGLGRRQRLLTSTPPVCGQETTVRGIIEVDQRGNPVGAKKKPSPRSTCGRPTGKLHAKGEHAPAEIDTYGEKWPGPRTQENMVERKRIVQRRNVRSPGEATVISDPRDRTIEKRICLHRLLSGRASKIRRRLDGSTVRVMSKQGRGGPPGPRMSDERTTQPLSTSVCTSEPTCGVNLFGIRFRKAAPGKRLSL